MNVKKILIGLGAVLSIPVLLIVAAFATEHTPADTEVAKIHTPTFTPSDKGEGQKLALGDRIRLVSWNLQFCGSRKHHFFYDGGRAVHVPEEDVRETMQSVKEALQTSKVDIALLQELDRNSARTHYIDQLQELVTFRPNLFWTAATYHRAPYVPTPGHQHMGRVDLNLGIFSTFALQNANRIQLALLDEPRWRQMFNLKRALLEVEIPVEGSKYPLHVGVTHLSAFSRGDGTLKKQLDRLQEWMAAHPPEQPYILAGDFNLLPPGDDPKRLKESELYSDAENPIIPLIEKYNTLFEDLLEPENRTYISYGSESTDRKIDYVFVGGPIQIEEKDVLHEYKHLSDHLPIQWTMTIGTKP